MWPITIALCAVLVAAGIWKLLDRLTFKLSFKVVDDKDLSPAEMQLAGKQNELDALQLDLAVAEELGVDPATLNAMGERIDLAKDGVADAQIALASEEAAAERTAEEQHAKRKLPGILRLPTLQPAALAARIGNKPDSEPADEQGGGDKTDKK